DMAGDDMPAKLVAQLERAFEVERAALIPVTLRGARERLRGDVDGEPARPLVDHCQAHARAGDRCAEIDRVGVVSGRDPRAQVAPPLDGLDPPYIGDDSSEHSGPIPLVRAR